MQPEKNHATSSHTKNQAISQQKNHVTSSQKNYATSRKIIMEPEWAGGKNHTTSPHTKITQRLQTYNHATFQQQKNLATSPPNNIARTAKRCPENITLVVKCLKLLFPKVLSKFIFFYSSHCSEKNYATSPHQKSGKLPLLTKQDNFWQNKMLDFTKKKNFCSYLSAHSLYGFYTKPQCRSQDQSYSSCTCLSWSWDRSHSEDSSHTSLLS